MRNERGPKDGVEREILIGRDVVAKRVRELDRKFLQIIKIKSPSLWVF
jgi:hypothetical protein